LPKKKKYLQPIGLTAPHLTLAKVSLIATVMFPDKYLSFSIHRCFFGKKIDERSAFVGAALRQPGFDDNLPHRDHFERKAGGDELTQETVEILAGDFFFEESITARQQLRGRQVGVSAGLLVFLEHFLEELPVVARLLPSTGHKARRHEPSQCFVSPSVRQQFRKLFFELLTDESLVFRTF
jgi:hypothetical protein